MTRSLRSSWPMALALVLALSPMSACGVADRLGSSDPNTSPSVAPAPSDAPSSEAPSTPDDTPEAGSGDVVDASTFSFTVPTLWRQSPAPTSGVAGVRSEAVVVGETTSGFRTNINVVSQALPAGASLEDYVAVTLRSARQQGYSVSSQPATVGDLDDAPTLGYTWSKRIGSLRLVQRQFAAEHDDRVYILTLSTPSSEYGASLRSLSAVQKSWRWT